MHLISHEEGCHHETFYMMRPQNNQPLRKDLFVLFRKFIQGKNKTETIFDLTLVTLLPPRSFHALKSSSFLRLQDLHRKSTVFWVILDVLQ